MTPKKKKPRKKNLDGKFWNQFPAVRLHHFANLPTKIYKKWIKIFLPPQYDKIRRGLNYKRSQCMPPPPKNLQEILIPETWRLTKNNQNILLHQEEGILIFATKQGLEFLVRSKNVLSDGTFKTAPAPCSQIYTIFGTAGSNDEW